MTPTPIENLEKENAARKCYNCFEVKPLTSFYKKLTGFQYRCKSCNAEVVRAYYRNLSKRKITERWAALRSSRQAEGEIK